MINVDFSKKMRGEGGLKIRTHADNCDKNGQKFADVLYGWPLLIFKLLFIYQNDFF